MKETKRKTIHTYVRMSASGQRRSRNRTLASTSALSDEKKNPKQTHESFFCACVLFTHPIALVPDQTNRDLSHACTRAASGATGTSDAQELLSERAYGNVTPQQITSSARGLESVVNSRKFTRCEESARIY